MDATRTVTVVAVGMLLAGCVSSGSTSPRQARANYCPAGTVMVCSGLYEAERELAPACGCAEVISGR